MRQGPSSSFKKRTLEDLFRPPIDITFKGTFASVRTFVRPCYYISFPVPHLFQEFFFKEMHNIHGKIVQKALFI